jgi:hypothetical protein
LGELSDPLDQEVHRERSGQTVFIILVSERQVDHDAGVVDVVRRINDLLGDDMLVEIDFRPDRFL